MRLVRNGLFAVLVLMLMAVTVWAEAPVPVGGDCSAYLYQEGSLITQEVSAAEENKIDAAKKIILEALQNGDEYIDFTGPGVYYERDIVPAYPIVINENPELFYVSGRFDFVDYKYDFERKDWYNMRIAPQYNIPVSEIAGAKAAFQAEISRIIAYASRGSTPMMKALLVNDFFCLNYQYDLSKSYYDAYSLFTKKTGVCNAYMLGYKVIMRALGIPVKAVTSEAMNHAWNLIQIGGTWYHVDVTWNDPVPDSAGKAWHAYFLRSDAGFLDNPYGGTHYSWVVENGGNATSTRYDDAIWCQSNVPSVVRGDASYYIRGYDPGEILARSSEKEDVIYTFKTTWKITTPEGMGSSWRGGFSWLGCYRDYLIFTVYDGIHALSLSDGSVKTLFSAPSGLGVWGAALDGNVVHYELGQNYNVITKRGDLILDFGGVTPVGKLLEIPAQTTVIEAEAFRSTKVRNVVGCAELQRIEPLAFAYCAELETVELGENVVYIADNSFEGCAAITFICPAGSYAEKYAAAHGFDVNGT